MGLMGFNAMNTLTDDQFEQFQIQQRLKYEEMMKKQVRFFYLFDFKLEKEQNAGV
jgi:hypothetical protein